MKSASLRSLATLPHAPQECGASLSCRHAVEASTVILTVTEFVDGLAGWHDDRENRLGVTLGVTLPRRILVTA